MKKESAMFSSVSKASSYNEGLRSYMLGVYNYMTVALMLSAVVAYFAAKSGLALALFSSPFGIIVSFAPIGVSLYLAAKFQNMSVSSVRNSLMLYAAIMGLSLSTIFIAFNFREIATAFCITASMFAGMSIYGYLTKKDLSSMGSMLIMAMWGLLVASLVNMFTHSSQLSLIISVIAVLVFSGMVAYDTQKLRQVYYMNGHLPSDMISKIAILGAMQLYIDFVAIFIHMLQLLRLGRDE
ncbi:MAG: Bax inhibitor-1/YccA family protein [Alphaproteobacteria bacterium]|nr:Bax inhibitor-1/YccA family protein [Rickettsiales bacterium]